MVFKLVRAVALIFVLSSCVLAVEDPQERFEQSLRERDRFYDAAVIDTLVTIKATDEVWNFVLDQGGFSTAQSASADLLYHYLWETAMIVPYVAESLRIADLSKVKRERSRSRKQKTLTSNAQKMLNDWKGRISYEIVMDFVPGLDKMDVAAENLDKVLSVTMSFAYQEKRFSVASPLEWVRLVCWVFQLGEGEHPSCVREANFGFAGKFGSGLHQGPDLVEQARLLFLG